MARTPHRDTLSYFMAAPSGDPSPRDSQITHATVAQRSARRLLSDSLRLAAGQRVLVLLSHGEGLAAAQQLVESAATTLGVHVLVLDTRTLSSASEAERRTWRDALERSQACILLGGEGRPAASRFEAELRAQAGHKPVAVLRFDPDALLAHGLLTPNVLQRAYARYLASRLRENALVSVRWQGGAPLQLLLGSARAPQRALSTRDLEFPIGHVAAPVVTGSGPLARPTSTLAPESTCQLPTTPEGIQFHAGVLRAVVGDGGAWLGQASRAFPGLRLRSFGFGLVAPSPSTIQRAGVRLTDVGCTLSVVDIRQRDADASVAAHRGLTFCLNGPGLEVDIDGEPIMRAGEFVEPHGAR